MNALQSMAKVGMLNLSVISLILWTLSGVARTHAQIDEMRKQRPIQIVRLSPEENAIVTDNNATVSAFLKLLKGRGVVLPGSLTLLLDGEDITDQSSIGTTLDQPPSQGEIFFEPTEPLAYGKHTAEVQFDTDEGRRFSYSWDFCVEQILFSHQSQCESLRPIQIARLFPGENATLLLEDLNAIGGDVDLLTGAQSVPTTSLRLSFDGENLTCVSERTTLTNGGTSRGRIEYTPPAQLRLGTHTAEIQFSNAEGEVFSYQWGFFLRRKEIPCYRLSVRFRDNGPQARIILDLKEYNLDNGRIGSLATFDSDAFPASPSYQNQSVQVCGDLDYQNTAYFIEVQLKKDSPRGDPGLAIMQLKPTGMRSAIDHDCCKTPAPWTAVASVGTVDEASSSFLVLGDENDGSIEIKQSRSPATLTVRYNTPIFR